MSQPAHCPSCGRELPEGVSCEHCEEATLARPQRRIPGFSLLDVLGQGAMGTVHLAQDEALGRRMAVKMLTDAIGRDLDARARFLREARVMATIENPGAGVLVDREPEGLRDGATPVAPLL